MRKKTVGDVMTHLDDAFMLSIDSVLDFETVSEIMKQGIYAHQLVGIRFVSDSQKQNRILTSASLPE